MKKIFTFLAMLICSLVFSQGNYNLEWESPVGENCINPRCIEKNNQVAEIIIIVGTFPNNT